MLGQPSCLELKFLLFKQPTYISIKFFDSLEQCQKNCSNYIKNFCDFFWYLIGKTKFFGLINIPMYFQRIVDSLLFKIINGILIICNLTFFTLSNSYPPVTNEQYKQFIFYCFAIEIGIRIIAAGGIYPTMHFLHNKEDMFNLVCTLITFLHYFYPRSISFDLSPLRIITILLYLGDGLLRLKYMLIALKKSLIFLAEAIFILLICLVSIVFQCIQFQISLIQSQIQYCSNNLESKKYIFEYQDLLGKMKQ